MSDIVNRRVLLTRRPVWTATPEDFAVEEVTVPAPGVGEVLVRVRWIAFDPAMRGWMNDGPSYAPPMPLGAVVRAHAVGEVVAGAVPELPVGALVSGNFGWQEYVVAHAGDSRASMLAHIHDESVDRPRAFLVPDGVPPTSVLGALGTTGLTAYFGMLELGRPTPGDIVLVSGAAGATGSIAGQLAKLAGATVIGIAGGTTKTKWLTDIAGFDHAVDYKSEDIAERVAELAPDGVNLFYDNIGQAVLEAGIATIAPRGTIVMCGGISSGHSNEAVTVGPRNMSTITVRSCTVKGFIVTDFADRFAEASRRMTDWVRGGQLIWEDDVRHGSVGDAVDTMNRLFDGKNFGKQLLQLDCVSA